MEDIVREVPRHPITGRSAWKGCELADRTDWVYTLPRAALADIDELLARLRERPVALTHMRRGHFPLTSIAGDLSRISDELENGRGFVVVRGLPLGKYSDEDVARIFWGIGTHLGYPISQNASGDLLGHVRAIAGLKYMDKNVRGYQTSAELFFHNDNCDVVGLLCFRKAKSGGVSRLASAMTLYNEVLAKHPEYLDVLARGFHYDLRGEELPGVAPLTPHRVPVYSYFERRLSCRYVYTAIVTAARKAGLAFTAEETAAMEFLNSTAQREDIRLEMMLEPGDMQFCNNHMVLHSRTAYEEWPEEDRKRHMLRLWLNNPNGRKLAPEFADRYGSGMGMGVPPVSGSTRAEIL
ncbi:MAG TPA: TauD/TfdA family dioxygenase [Burkholderiales bacterium]|nr:TauD/TfdA family dioxygenase [Burkholderiales bacterium]